MSPKYNKHVQLWKSNHRCTRILLEIFVYDRVMTARCCGCSRALELGKELVEKWEKMGIKERKEEKKHCRPADVASLQCHPLPRCWHASIVVTMRGFIQTRLLPCHTSASLFMHCSHHTTASFTHYIQNATVNIGNSTSSSILILSLVEFPLCLFETSLCFENLR